MPGYTGNASYSSGGSHAEVTARRKSERDAHKANGAIRSGRAMSIVRPKTKGRLRKKSA